MEKITDKIGGYMLRNDVGKGEFAQLLDLDARQFTKRVKGEIDWRLTELGKVAEIVGCSIDELVKEEE